MPMAHLPAGTEAAAVAEALPLELLNLVGYDRGANSLGYVDDLHHPLEAISAGLGSVGLGTERARVSQ